MRKDFNFSVKHRPTSNYAGSKYRSPGDNIINAIFDVDIVFGISDSDCGKVLDIIREYLNEEEYNIVNKAFGLGCERVQVKQIAEEMEIEPEKISVILKRAIEKMGNPSCANRILEFVPTYEETKEALQKYKQIKELEAEVKELRHQKSQAILLENTIRQKDAIITEEEQEIASLRTEIARIKSFSVGELLNNPQVFNRCESGTRNEANAQEVNDTHESLQDLLSRIQSGLTLEEMFSDWLMKKLEGAGIIEIKTLLKQRPKMLKDSGFSKKEVNQVQDILQKYGLSLKIAL